MADKKTPSKAEQQAAQKPATQSNNQTAKPKKKRLGPKDMQPVGTNGIESRKTVNRWFGLGSRETHTVYNPTSRVPATEKFQAKGAPAKPAPTQDPKGRKPATDRFKATGPPSQPAPAQSPSGRVPAPDRFKAKPAKGTIFDNDIAEHRRSNGLPPAPPRGQKKGGPQRGGKAKGGPSR